VELQQIVERYAEAFEHVDASTQTQKANRRTGVLYHQGLHSLGEVDAIGQADLAWDVLHPGEFIEHFGARTGVSYPTIARTACDHVFSTIAGDDPEWAIEGKFISFVGDNGKNNDYGVGKMLSPYLKDRGVLHDAARLREHGFSRRVAVMLYAFNYDTTTCDEAAARHPSNLDVINNIRDVIEKNGAPLYARPVIELLDAILGLRGYLRGPRAQADFEAWRHPAGGRGTVYGWEIRRPHLEPNYDPRHPW
jgi:hypothetical protein